jgi:hypothetical protein
VRAVGDAGSVKQVSAAKVRLCEVPMPRSLEAGASVIATHPDYGESPNGTPRW